MKLFIVIPFLNESGNFKRLADDLSCYINDVNHFDDYEIIFINDGSSDNSAKEIQKEFVNLKFKVISHERNLGPGAAFQTAFIDVLQYASDDDHILTIEADNTSNIKIVSQMFQRTVEGYDVILASPYMYGGSIVNTSFIRRFLSFFANLFLRELLDLRGIFTISSFFRLYKVKILKIIFEKYNGKLIENNGFEGKVELLMKMVFCKTKISEVPLVLDTSKRVGKSKMKLFSTTLRMLALFVQKKSWIIKSAK